MEIPTEGQHYKSFEADRKLYQSKKIFFGMTIVVPWFQRIIDDIIKRNNCKEIFAYLDNITICGKTKEEHDANLKNFFEATAKDNLTFNKNKCIYSSDCISLLRYQINNRTLRPDPDCVKSLLKMPVPKSKTN